MLPGDNKSEPRKNCKQFSDAPGKIFRFLELYFSPVPASTDFLIVPFASPGFSYLGFRTNDGSDSLPPLSLQFEIIPYF
jgi:hypothetical protein